jgi:DNA (cytosine-5)-methyltransferase 1
MLRVLDLFSGIGGFSLGLERTGGFRTVAFCEIEPFCQRVLAKHWPEVPIYDDIRELTGARLAADGIAVDVICGGFPCQDISVAGRGAGIEGARSGLWSEYARLVRELRPKFVIVENVAALLGRGLDRVLGDLAEIGFDAEWHCIPAAAVGAPHFRDRVWIVANPGDCGHGLDVQSLSERRCNAAPYAWGDGAFQSVAHAHGGNGLGRSGAVQVGWGGRASEVTQDGDAAGAEWAVEPAVGRVAYGVSHRLERLTALGNGLVPQIPELIGKAILEAEGSR